MKNQGQWRRTDVQWSRATIMPTLAHCSLHLCAVIRVREVQATHSKKSQQSLRNLHCVLRRLSDTIRQRKLATWCVWTVGDHPSNMPVKEMQLTMLSLSLHQISVEVLLTLPLVYSMNETTISDSNTACRHSSKNLYESRLTWDSRSWLFKLSLFSYFIALMRPWMVQLAMI